MGVVERDSRNTHARIPDHACVHNYIAPRIYLCTHMKETSPRAPPFSVSPKTNLWVRLMINSGGCPVPRQSMAARHGNGRA
jgi:hypothetical protein